MIQLLIITLDALSLLLHRLMVFLGLAVEPLVTQAP